LEYDLDFGTPFLITKANYSTGVTVAVVTRNGTLFHQIPYGKFYGNASSVLACNPRIEMTPHIQPIVGPARDTLLPDNCLFFGHSLTSASGCFSLLFQPDGNLVLRKKNNPTVLFETKTANTGSFQVCLLSKPGNLIVQALGSVPFYTITSRATSVKLENDGNLIVYERHYKLWTSNTTQTNITC
jgi:hypothetical protein